MRCEHCGVDEGALDVEIADLTDQINTLEDDLSAMENERDKAIDALTDIEERAKNYYK